MVYNVDFLLAALIFLLIIFRHFMEQRALNTKTSKAFLTFLLLGIANIGFDLLCTVFITLSRPELAWMTEFSLTILYLLQVLVPVSMLNYVRTFYETDRVLPRWVRLCRCGPTLMIVTLILLNHWHGLFFRVDSSGTYLRGPYYLGMYLFAGGYILAVTIVSHLHAEQMGWQKVRAIYELLLVVSVCVVFQFVYHDILLTGFGIAMCISILFFTINNPYQYTDSLTGLFDLNYFREQATYYLQRKKSFHVLEVDLCQLKRINRILGTDTGNQALIQAAQLLRQTGRNLRVFRSSGKHFLLICPTISDYVAAQQKIRDMFSQPMEIGGSSVYSPVVICGVMHAEQLDSCEFLVGYLEYLSSLVTQTNRTVLIQGDQETLKGFRYMQEIELFLQTALEKDLFEVYFQPVYSTTQKRYVSIEALSRLRHPVLGPVSPEIFIGLAEKNDQIARLGLLQMRRICGFLKARPELFEQLQSVKINLSPLEILKKGHIQQLIQTIRDSGIPTSFFAFEITETVATDYSESLRKAVDLFTEAGIGLCLDDFGSGYANLNSVVKLPFSVIKMDRSLLSGICTDEKAAALYRNTVTVLRNMDFTVIAEGVETKTELELLSGWGVDIIQGFYFSPPLSFEKLLALLDTGKEAVSESLAGR